MQEDPAVDRRAARLSALLRATDVPAPAMAFPAERIAQARRRARLRWQLAAAAVLLVLGAGIVRPVRAWIAEAARSFFLGAAREAAAPAPAPAVDMAPEPPPSVPTNVVTFTPGSGAFLVQLRGRQRSGALTIARADAAVASVALTGDPADAEFLVQPEGLRILNRPEAVADYVLRVPPGVARVTVRIGREPGRHFALTADADVLVPLAPASERPN